MLRLVTAGDPPGCGNTPAGLVTATPQEEGDNRAQTPYGPRARPMNGVEYLAFVVLAMLACWVRILADAEQAERDAHDTAWQPHDPHGWDDHDSWEDSDPWAS